MTAVDVDALAKLREAIVPGPDFSWDAVETLLYALPDLIAAVRERDALRAAVEGLAAQWLASSVLGLSALAGAGRELRRVLVAVDGDEQ